MWIFTETKTSLLAHQVKLFHVTEIKYLFTVAYSYLFSDWILYNLKRLNKPPNNIYKCIQLKREENHGLGLRKSARQLWNAVHLLKASVPKYLYS